MTLMLTQGRTSGEYCHRGLLGLQQLPDDQVQDPEKYWENKQQLGCRILEETVFDSGYCTHEREVSKRSKLLWKIILEISWIPFCSYNFRNETTSMQAWNFSRRSSWQSRMLLHGQKGKMGAFKRWQCGLAANSIKAEQITSKTQL